MRLRENNCKETCGAREHNQGKYKDGHVLNDSSTCIDVDNDKSTSPDGTRAVYIFRYYSPRIPPGKALELSVMRAERSLWELGLPVGLELRNQREPCAGYPIRSLNENWYQDFSLSARAWIGTDGMAYVAFATNAAGGGPDTDQCMVLTSLENIYQLK